jgi:hypothetical protein
MIRLLKIELGKLRGYRSFWFLTAVYILMLAGLVFGIPEFIDYLISKTGENTKLRIFKAVVFNFPDIWQNIGFIASSRFFIKNVLALIVILVITNEYMY